MFFTVDFRITFKNKAPESFYREVEGGFLKPTVTLVLFLFSGLNLFRPEPENETVRVLSREGLGVSGHMARFSPPRP